MQGAWSYTRVREKRIIRERERITLPLLMYSLSASLKSTEHWRIYFASSRSSITQVIKCCLPYWQQNGTSDGSCDRVWDAESFLWEWIMPTHMQNRLFTSVLFSNIKGQMQMPLCRPNKKRHCLVLQTAWFPSTDHRFLDLKGQRDHHDRSV